MITGIIPFRLLFPALSLAMVYSGCSLNKRDRTPNLIHFPEKALIVKLPEPVLNSSVSIEEAIHERRSIRDFKEDALTVKEIGQLLWAAQGITGAGGKRSAPSAGGLYPLELYLAVWHVDSLETGVYHYHPASHSLEQILTGDVSMTLADAVNQGTSKEGAAALIITGIYRRTTWRFREKGKQYVFMEAGHAAQNVCLQAVSLNIGTVTMGSFNDSLVKSVLYLPASNDPLYIMPLGKKK